jgi:hypothetical protein
MERLTKTILLKLKVTDHKLELKSIKKPQYGTELKLA